MDNVERDYKYISPPAVIVISILSIIGGYFYGWYVNQENNTYSFLIALILFFVAKIPVKIWNAWEEYVTEKRRQEDVSKLVEKTDREIWKERTEEKIKRKLEAQFKKSSPVGLFNHDDFDAESQTLLMKLVVDAKKKPSKKVSKTDLLSSVLVEHYLPKNKKVA